MVTVVDQYGRPGDGDWNDVGPNMGWNNGLPNAQTDAFFAASYSSTVTFNTTAETHVLGSSGVPLKILGGSLTIDSTTAFDGTPVGNQGSFDISAGAAFTLKQGAGRYVLYGLTNAGTVTIGAGATLETS